MSCRYWGNILIPSANRKECSNRATQGVGPVTRPAGPEATGIFSAEQHCLSQRILLVLSLLDCRQIKIPGLEFGLVNYWTGQRGLTQGIIKPAGIQLSGKRLKLRTI